MSEARTLVVTVGKSLFSSATWRAEDPFDFRGYRKWLEELDDKGKPFFLRNPERRAKDDATCKKIRSVLSDLSENPPARLSGLVSIGDSEDSRRYCAELTTLLVMYRETKHGATSFQEFLSGYGAVELICPSDSNDEANIAARHLEQVLLSHGARSSSEGLLKPVLRSGSSRQRIRQWGEHLGTLNIDNVDLAVTGGYKGFALLAGDAWARTGSERGWRVIYLHQDNETDLFVHEEGKIVVRSPGETPETVYRPASGTL